MAPIDTPRHRRRLACPLALPPGARGLVDGVLEHAGDRAVVFGRDEQHAVGGRDVLPQACDGRDRRLRVTVLAVQRQIVDAHEMRLHLGRKQAHQRFGELAVVRLLADAADHDSDVQGFHVRRLHVGMKSRLYCPGRRPGFG